MIKLVDNKYKFIEQAMYALEKVSLLALDNCWKLRPIIVGVL